MSLWTSSLLTLGLFLLQTIQVQTQRVNADSTPVASEEITVPSEDQPRPLILKKRDWDLTRAYFDVFNILSNENPCSHFYGGPRSATTVLNGFVSLVRSQPLTREVSFQMAGTQRLVRSVATGASYRLFERTTVNTNGSFYQRRVDSLRKFPADVGDFAPGSRKARALILLHELGHLIQGEDGDWLIPDDGYDGPQSNANTLRVQQACRRQLDTLK
jgi:hypothetical protein